MADTELAESGREDLAAVGRAVVGEHALDDDAVGGVEGPRAGGEDDRRVGGGGRRGLLSGEPSQPDCAYGTEGAEPLGVEMAEFARPLPLVALARRPWLQAIE